MDLTLILNAQDMATRTLKRVQSQIGRLNRSAVGLAKRGFNSMANSWSNTASTIGGSIPALMAGFTGLSGLVLTLATDSQETRNRFNAVFGDMSDRVNKFAKETAKATGRATDEIRSGLSSFQSMAVGLGFAQDEATDFSKKLQTLAIDFGSFNNLADQEVMDRFIAAMSGSSEVLDQFGVNIKATALDQKLLEKGLPSIASGATEAEKAIARLAIIEEVMGRQGAIGDAVKTANDFANQLRRLRSVGIDFAVAIGSRLIPPAEKLLSWFFKILPTLDQFNGMLDTATEKVKGWVDRGLEKAQPVIEALGGKTETFKTILAGLAGAITALVIPALAILVVQLGLVLAPFVLIGLAVAGLYQAWKNNFKGIRDLTEQAFSYISIVVLPLLIDKFNYFKDEILPDLIEKIKSFVNTFKTRFEELGGIVGIFTIIRDFITNNFGPTLGFLQTLFESLWIVVETLVSTFNTFLLPALILIGGMLLWLGSAIIASLISAWKNLQEPIMEFLSSVMELVAVLTQILAPAVGFIIAVLVGLVSIIMVVLIPTFQILWAIVVEAFKGILKVVTGVVSMMTGVLQVLIGTIKGLFTGDFSLAVDGFKNLWEGMVSFLEGLLDIILSPVRGMIQGIKDIFKGFDLFQAGKDMIKSLIDGIASMTGEVASAVANITNKIPGAGQARNLVSNIPGFAVGTAYHKGGPAIVGENGPELVNMPAGSKVSPNSATERTLANQNQGNNITIAPVINFHSLKRPTKAWAKEAEDTLEDIVLSVIKKNKLA